MVYCILLFIAYIVGISILAWYFSLSGFIKFHRKCSLSIYKNVFGFRRFFVSVWWRELFGIPERKAKRITKRTELIDQHVYANACLESEFGGPSPLSMSVSEWANKHREIPPEIKKLKFSHEYSLSAAIAKNAILKLIAGMNLHQKDKAINYSNTTLIKKDKSWKFLE